MESAVRWLKMSRHPWIAAFIGHVLRLGATDPDSVFQTATSLFAESWHLDPEFVAESMFGALELQERSREAPSSGARP